MSRNAEELVSVIIPTYNRSPVVGDAVESALDQIYQSIEVLVIDDGSTDDTEAALETLGDSIRYIRQRNAGCAAARNRGIAEARGEYIAFLDPDDLFTQDKISQQVGTLRQHPSADFCYGPHETYYDNRPEYRVLSAPAAGADFRQLRSEYLLDPSLSCGALLFRRAVFDRLGSFDEELRYDEEGEFTQRLVLECTGVWSGDEPVVIRHRKTGHEVENPVAHAREVLGNAYRTLERHPKYCRRLGSRGDDYLARCYLALGKALLQKGSPIEASECFDVVAQLSPRRSRRPPYLVYSALSGLGAPGRPFVAVAFALGRLVRRLFRRLGLMRNVRKVG